MKPDLPKHVLIVDDHKSVREGIAQRLEAVPEVTVVGEADSCTTAVDQIERLDPHIVLLDVRLSDGSGLDLSRQLTSNNPDLAIVLHTAQDISPAELAKSGATAAVVKRLINDDLIETLSDIAGGRMSVTK